MKKPTPATKLERAYQMYNCNDTYHYLVWQQLVIQAQELALKLPEMGLNPDKLIHLPIMDLIGVLAFLKRSYADKQAL
mgnify:CR=1 FL=1